MKIISFLLLFVLSLAEPISAQVELPRLISDGLVLQRNSEIEIWGWASKGETVTISFLGEKYETTADKKGTWSITLTAIEAGGPYEMDIQGKNKVLLKEVYVGDVWVASGQSNMELPMSRVEPRYPKEVATASNPKIRFFQVSQAYNFKEPQKDLESGSWKPVTPENIKEFSAVAYFFARDLQRRYDVPIGIINSSLGGSPAEAWISEESLKKFPEHYKEALRFRKSEVIDSIQNADNERINAWYSQSTQKDKGYTKGWKSKQGATGSWSSMEIPGYWADEEIGEKNGVLWFQKQVELSKELASQSPKLLVGRIVDADSVFVNGTYVGNTTYQYPPRRYSIPEGVLKEGKNLITIRVINERGKGGFVPDKPYKLVFPNTEVDLSGEWKFKLGAEMPALQGQTFVRWKPLGLYNAMINPLTNYSIKGVIWYQGESNADTPAEYEDLFKTLIRDWREKWKQGDFSFLFVQLANFMEASETPQESNWARLRESQLNTLCLPKTGMAVITDIGEWNDIHPLNKEDVGKRLAQAANKIAYNENVVSGGPLYESFEIKGDSIVISFKNTGKGLVAKKGELHHFAIAGKDKKFVWAKAKINGDKVVVYHPEIENPVAVRYAWADNPESANLYNEDGFPASAFRTDDWD